MGTAIRQSTTIDFVEEYAAAAERFAVAVAWSDLRAAVPSCPDWTLYDLVVHIGNVHAWAATIVETGRSAVGQNDEPPSSRPRAVSQWYAGKAEDLYEVLRHARLGDPCWNFAFGTGVAGFWPRRQVHETTVHQVDLDQAAGRESQLAPELCADGVDEVLTVFAHRMHHRGHPARLEQPIVLTATDTGDQWVVTPRRPPGATAEVPAQPVGTHAESVPTQPPTVRRRATAVVHGDRVEARADVLYRMLWHRLPADHDAAHVEGDPGRVRDYLSSRLVP